MSAVIRIEITNFQRNLDKINYVIKIPLFSKNEIIGACSSCTTEKLCPSRTLPEKKKVNMFVRFKIYFAPVKAECTILCC